MRDKSPNKIRIEKEIFRFHSDNPIKWKEIKHVELQDDDVLGIGFEEAFYSEDNSYDGF